MKMRKIISYIAVAVLALGVMSSFAACGKTAPTVTGIEISTAPTKTKYIVGEEFDPAGMVVSKLLSDETKEVLAAADYTYSPNGKLKITDKNVTVAYNSGEESFTASVKISVTNEIADVKILTEPDKKEYITGETFDPEGMTIQAVRQDGTKEEVVAVNPDDVTYNTGRLVASDSHFEMNYGGFTFYYDMIVKCGAFIEAESGLIIASGVKVGDAPNQIAVEADLNNAYCVNGEGTPSVRGIDIGSQKKGDDNKDYTISESRVDVRNYIFDPDDTEYDYMDFCATGGGNHSSYVAHTNILEFERTAGASVMYALAADKAGAVNLTLRMSVFDPDNSSVSPASKLGEVLEITVNGTRVSAADSVDIPSVDFSQKKSYVPVGSGEPGTIGNYKGTFTGKSIRTKYYWQNITVPITVQKDANSIIIKSVVPTGTKKDIYIDSVSFDGDEQKVSLYSESAFAPEIKSAKLKVENEKVYMGLIVDAKSVGYSEDVVKNVLGLTRVKTGCCTWQNNGDGNINENGVGEKNDPWTSPVSNGGLGYTQPPLLQTSGKGGDWGAEINKREVSVEKIPSGEFENCYYVWMEVTTPDDPKGQTPQTNRYVGAFYFSGFTYGSNYANIHPANDVLKDEEGTCVSSGDYCYQVFCDTRDRYACFYAGNEINLILVVQNGTFDASAATDTLPLRNKLMRKYVGSFGANNDQELIDLRQPKA